MKKLLFTLLLAVTSSAFAFPILKITAPVQFLAVGQSTTVTFNFIDSATGSPVTVTGFTLSDAIIQGSAIWTSGLSGSGSTYTATLQKLDTKSSTSVIVDNKTFQADGQDGSGNTIGFNMAPLFYVKSGNTFTGKLVVADPQPRCPLPGEFLADAAGNPSSRANEDYFILAPTGRQALIHQRVVSDCLTRLVAGQQFKLKASPAAHELVNPHGPHNHNTLMPKATTDFIKPLQGTTKFKIAPSNNGQCSLDSNLVLSCDTRGIYNGVRISNAGGESRFITKASKFLTDDPIIYPGVRGAAHLHIFYGNNAVDYTTNNANIKTACSSLMAGGLMNCTGYWTPAIIDTATNIALVPQGINVYYKRDSFGGPTEPFRPGLRIIAGNPAANGPGQAKDDTRFLCRGIGSVPELNVYSNDGGIPECDGSKYDDINIFVNFPSCVADDGFGNQKLDSPDHRSHLRKLGGNTTENGTAIANGCTTLFPHKISSITQNVHYTIKPGQNTKTWRLSSDNYSSSIAGGFSTHADWLNGWNNYFIDRIVRDCNNSHFNCGNQYIGMHDGIGIASVTTTGDKAVITTQNPHRLEISNPTTGAYPNLKEGGDSMLLARISGFTGTDAAAYNFNIDKISSIVQETGLKLIAPSGVQRIKILNATQIEFTLYYTPTTPINGAVNPDDVRITWGEVACQYQDTNCNPAYNEFYYKDKQ